MKSQFIAERGQVAEDRALIVFVLGGLLGLYFVGYVIFLVAGYFAPPTSLYAPRTDGWILQVYRPLEWLRHLCHATR